MRTINQILRKLTHNEHGDMATMAIGVAIVLITGIISALIYFNVSANVPHTDDDTNETIDNFTTYAKLAFLFIGIGAFVGAAFMIIGIMRGNTGGV